MSQGRIAVVLRLLVAASLTVTVTAEDNSTDAVVTGIEPSLGEAEWAERIVLPIAGVLCVALMIASILHHNTRFFSWVPESAVVMLCGALLGAVLRRLLHSQKWATTETFHETNSIVLNLLLLPMIIFESGWSLRTKDFASQIVHIMIFAIFGTILSMVTVACLMKSVSEAYFPILSTHEHHAFGAVSWRLALCYAVLISAVDPVACLATYSSLKVDPLLNIIVFGESTINDAVAIAIFKVLNDSKIMNSGTESLFTTCVLSVVWLLGGSIVLGFVFALVSALLLRHTALTHSTYQSIMFIYLSAFVTFSFAEGVCELSGIISVLFHGIFMGIYARPLIRREGSLLASFFLKQMASLGDMWVYPASRIRICGHSVQPIGAHRRPPILRKLVFLFAGAFASLTTWRDGRAGVCIMAFCLVGRAVGVFPLGYLCNLIKRWHHSYYDHPEEDWNILTNGHLVCMWWAGLRGGIALVLCLDLGDWADAEWPNARKTLRNATFLLVCTFLVILGGTTGPILKACHVPIGCDAAEDHLYRTASGWWQRCLGSLNRKILSPLIHGDIDRGQDLRNLDILEVIRGGSSRSLASDSRGLLGRSKSASSEWSETDCE